MLKVINIINAQRAVQRTKHLALNNAKKLTNKVVCIKKNTKKNDNTGLTIDQIVQVISRYYKIDIYQLPSGKKGTNVVKRQICHFFCAFLTKESLDDIGKEIGKKTHATVMHSYKTIYFSYLYNKKYEKLINDIDSFIFKKLGIKLNWELIHEFMKNKLK